MAPVPEAFRLLYAKRQSVIKPGLERVKQACACFGGIESAVPSIVIGGTNGKGSTAGMLWRLYAAHGERVGLFTSPHLESFAERIQITDFVVDEALIERELLQLQQVLPAALYDEMSFFELTTVLALKIFRDAGCTLNILEVGLGGRLDSTNIGQPLTTAIVSIGMDHMALLGSTPAEIAREKCGIMRPGTPVFWGGRASAAAEADREIRTQAAALSAPLFEAGIDFSWDRVSETAPKLLRDAPGYLRNNFAMAVALMRETQVRRGVSPTAARDQVDQAVRGYDQPSLPWPPTLVGRFSEILINLGSDVSLRPNGAVQPLLFDVCHNVDGAVVFVKALREKYGNEVRLPGLVSMMKDKDTTGIVDILQGVLSPLMLFRNENERSVACDFNFDAIWRHARERFPVRADAPWVVCGSVMAVGEVLAYLREHRFLCEATKSCQR